MNDNTSMRISRRNQAGTLFSVADSVFRYLQRLVRPNASDNTMRGALEELIEEGTNLETPIVVEQRNLLENIPILCLILLP